jgi:uncharacterized RDD family membrane protein YckC
MARAIKRIGTFAADTFCTIVGGVFYTILWGVILTIFIGSHRAVYVLPFLYPIALVYAWRELIRGPKTEIKEASLPDLGR